MGFLSGLGRGLRDILDGAAGTQALITGDYGAHARLRRPPASRLAARTASEEEALRREGLIDRLFRLGLDADQVQLALANPEVLKAVLPVSGMGGSEVASRPAFAHEPLPSNHPLGPNPAMPPADTFGDTIRAGDPGDPAPSTGRPELEPELRLPARDYPFDNAPQVIASNYSQPGPEAGERHYIRGPHTGQLARMKGVNGYGYAPEAGDELLLARALFAEGAGVPRDMEAHAFAIVNRVSARGRPGSERGENRATLREVLGVEGQFPFMPDRERGRPNGSEQWVLSGQPDRMTGLERRSWNIARNAARRALSGQVRDPTGGATYYFASPEYDGRAGSAPDPFFRGRLADRTLRPSQYRTPYPRLPQNRRAPWPTYFFEHREDFPAKD